MPNLISTRYLFCSVLCLCFITSQCGNVADFIDLELVFIGSENDTDYMTDTKDSFEQIQPIAQTPYLTSRTNNTKHIQQAFILNNSIGLPLVLSPIKNFKVPLSNKSIEPVATDSDVYDRIPAQNSPDFDTNNGKISDVSDIAAQQTNVVTHTQELDSDVKKTSEVTLEPDSDVKKIGKVTLELDTIVNTDNTVPQPELDIIVNTDSTISYAGDYDESNQKNTDTGNLGMMQVAKFIESDGNQTVQTNNRRLLKITEYNKKKYDMNSYKKKMLPKLYSKALHKPKPNFKRTKKPTMKQDFVHQTLRRRVKKDM